MIAVLLAVPAATAALDPPDTGSDSPCRVSLIEPREGEILYGMVDLSAEAVCPESTAPDRVQFLADGEVVAEATRAPFRAVWEAGGTFRQHLILSAWRSSDNSPLKANRRSPAKKRQYI